MTNDLVYRDDALAKREADAGMHHTMYWATVLRKMLFMRLGIMAEATDYSAQKGKPMTKTNELIAWLKTPLQTYEGDMGNHHDGHLLDREECDAVIAALEAAAIMFAALQKIGLPRRGSSEEKWSVDEIGEHARQGVSEWEKLQ